MEDFGAVQILSDTSRIQRYFFFGRFAAASRNALSGFQLEATFSWFEQPQGAVSHPKN